MPDVNIYYVLAVGLLDGTVSFADSHSFEKMKDPRVTAVMKRVELVGDKALVVPDAPRSGLVEVTLRDGRRVSHFTRHAPGTKENPVSVDGVNEKVRDLIAPVIGPQRTEEVIRRVHAIEQIANVRDFVRSSLVDG
jgi:2-methylcitrate dehydratase PrpD